MVVIVWLSHSPLTAISWAAIYYTFDTSGKVIPGTESITPGPGIDLSGWNTPGHELESAKLSSLDLSDATFANSDVMHAGFNNSNLTNVNFTGAAVNGASFFQSTGFTSPQLYSTASYANHNLAVTQLGRLNLTGWNFAGQNLTNASFFEATVTDVDFTSADLTFAQFSDAPLTNANFTGAIVKFAFFSGVTGFTQAQLYSTASYANHDLAGVYLESLYLAGWNFANQNLAAASIEESNLTNASFAGANLTNAIFFHSNLANASFGGAIINGTDFRYSTGFTTAQLYSTASYVNRDLSYFGLQGLDMTGVNFANQNLAHADLYATTLTNADFTGAVVRGAIFGGTTSFTAAQLYSTASYANHDLASIQLYSLVLSGWNFADQNLTAATFSNVTLPNADFSGADLRGTTGWSPVASTITHNTIRPDGSIQGLAVQAAEKITVRNYPLAITVATSATFDPTAMLQIVFDADAWHSTISFAPGVTVTRGGTLDLEVAAGVDPSTLVGHTFDLFNWTGVSAIGNFTISSPYTWDLSKLYTTGEATLLAASGIPGDFNHDNVVNAADYVVWRSGLGTIYSPADYDMWRTHFGQTAGSGALANAHMPVPEPNTCAFVCIAALLMSSRLPWIIAAEPARGHRFKMVVGTR